MKGQRKKEPILKKLKKYFQIRKRLVILSTITLVLLLLITFGYLLYQFGIISSTFTVLKAPSSSNVSESSEKIKTVELTTSTEKIITSSPRDHTTKTPELSTTSLPIATKLTISTTTIKSTTPIPHLQPVRYAVKTEGCLIPDLDPHDPSTWGYLEIDQSIKCEKSIHLPLVDTNNSAIFVNPKTRDLYYNATDVADCCWRPYYRSKIKDNRVIPTRDCKPLQGPKSMYHDYINVECRLRNSSVYNDFIALVPHKPIVEERSEKLAKLYKPKRKLSVLVIGKHGMSRLGLQRFMPNTVQALHKIGAVEMLGYTKVAKNMYENLVPLLTGLTHFGLKEYRLNYFNKTYDMSPFLWRNFTSRGYRTIFAEDNCTMSTFNYLKPGFRMQPTDYYLRPLCLAALPKIGDADKCFTNMCEGSRFMTNRLMKYTRAAATEFAYKPYFGFFWQINGNHGYDKEAQLDDEAYYDLLMYLHENDLLRNTALVFLSDHGEWNPFEWTYQGQLEERMPFAFISLPNWWKNQHPDAWKALHLNSKRLTTPFDVHETLLDILDPSRLGPQEDSNEIPQEFGSSLFKPISEKRTCASAHIPEQYCTCHHRHEISRDSIKVKKLKNLLTNEINSIIANETCCAKLESSLVDVKVLEENANYMFLNGKWEGLDYLVTIQTHPGNGIFRALIKEDAPNSMKLDGPIKRLNIYARESYCVKDFESRIYCYCQITKKCKSH